MNTNGTFSLLIFALPLLLLGWLFFTQNKRMRQMREFSSALNVGDRVITSSGVYGTIKHLDDSSAWLEVSEGTTIRFDRRAVAMKQADPAAAAPTATESGPSNDTPTDDTPGTTPGSPQSGQ